MSKHAAVTIVSKNYLSYAKTLAESYKKHHPDNDFLIVLVDRADGYIANRLSCGAEVIEISDIRIPDIARFVYRYTIMELNTAVKPFILADLFDRRNYETILYLDPDIWVFRPLSDIYDALQDASIVLIPHMRRPFYDNGHPSDLSILQSGTYNLGFVGLKHSESADRLLEWWMTKLYRDCVVDIPKGLFVDQKWMDMIPGFFPDHHILPNPAYNVAYWNLHERNLTIREDAWYVDEEPLAFFHFSGYTPFAPHQLSKHQNRHRLDSLPALKKLTDLYAKELFSNGYQESSSWPYAFETLSNGVRLPSQLVRDVMQWTSRARVPSPNPIEDPDEFCRFLMSRGVPDRPMVVTLFHFLLKRRTDVAAAHSNALHDSSDKGFREWIKRGGAVEEKIEDLLPFEKPEISDYVADAFQRLRKTNRRDVFENFKRMWESPEIFDKFAEWFTIYGINEVKCLPEHTERLKQAVPGVLRILNIYFLRGDLQVAFPSLWEEHQRRDFANWLRANRYDLDLSREEISLFTEYAQGSRETIEKMRFLYQHFGQQRRSSPSIYAIDEDRYKKQIVLETKKILDWLGEETAIDPADHYVARFRHDTSRLDDFDRITVPGLSPKKNFEFVEKIRKSLPHDPAQEKLINFAGFLTAPSGMGESARSMLSTLRHADVKFKPFTIPHPRAQTSTMLPSHPAIFGWPSGLATASVTVANADSKSLLESVLPSIFWAKKNVGYWVWETEQLPHQFKESETLFDEIWTPSTYSADAIRRTVDRKVCVLPHTLDFASIDQATADRAKFGLPEEATLFGFMFDPMSVLERKNVAGLIDAFGKAFRDDDDCYLVLKLNSSAVDAYDYDMVRAHADGNRVIFVETTLPRQEAYDFMKSLDVYVSLHRSEGFGLTCAEAMALGLPVVASNYSGNLEFMDESNSLLVPTPVIETERPYGPYPAGTHWGAPDPDAAAEALRSLRDEEKRLELGTAGAESVRASLAPAKIGALARTMVLDLLG